MFLINVISSIDNFTTSLVVIAFSNLGENAITASGGDSIDNFTTPLVVIAFSNLDDQNLNIIKSFSTTLWSLLLNSERNLTNYDAIFFNSG